MHLPHFSPISAAEAVHGVNSVLGEEGSSPAALLESLANEHVGVVNVQEAQALQYLNLLKAMKTAKAEVGEGVGGIRGVGGGWY